MPAPANRILNVVPDRLDLRDRLYQPPVDHRPKAAIPHPGKGLPILHQGPTNACTGFALATVIHRLLNGSAALKPVSPFMLYAMARRYDEFEGSTGDTGSSLRGALKGWYKHGACKDALWPTKDTSKTPQPDPNPAKDWRREAAQRPLGAYYRVDVRSITDMQIALNEAGVLYASARCHAGWDAPDGADETYGLKLIPYTKGPAPDGHAFALVGYTPEGFIIQNSWGKEWGAEGLAILTYEDWLDNAMDCWVAQLGVVTKQHEEVGSAGTLRMAHNRVRLAAEGRLRSRELDPFIVDMENNGALSRSGEFLTTPEDLKALVEIHIPEARKAWGLKPDEPMDIALYAHGGLVGEGAAAATAARWIPALYERRIFPIFFMWETDWWTTLKDRMEDLWRGQPQPAGSFGENMKRFWDERLERFFSAPGALLWSEMKQNADAISASPESGATLLYEAFQREGTLGKEKVRLHLIGHSAGAILHCHLAQRMAQAGWQFGAVAFMAPAATTELFQATLLPLINGRKVGRYHQFHLSDTAERQDRTCSALLGYSRSLLYLVSRSFEGRREAPILGMETHFRAQVEGALSAGTFGTTTAPCAESGSTSHGGFDEDEATLASVLGLIAQQAERPTVGVSMGAGGGKKLPSMDIKKART